MHILGDFVTDPFESDPNECSLAGSWTRPRKAWIWSKNGGMWACALEHTLSPISTSHGQSCFTGFPTAGRKWSPCLSGEAALLTLHITARGAFLHTTRRRHLELSVMRSSCTWSWAEVLGSHFSLGTVVWSAGCEASTRGTLWASETRLSTEEKKKKVRFYLITQILFLLPGKC